MTAKQLAILAGKLCPYCGRTTKYEDSALIYGGKSYGMIYICWPCRAYCGCHKESGEALGSIADEKLRDLRVKTHAAFDKLWKTEKIMTRNNAYKWLSNKLDLPFRFTHIAMFSTQDCLDCIRFTEEYIRKYDPL